MILDNADNPTVWGHTAKDSEGLLSHFIPQTDNGSVLVTSRSTEASYGLVGDYNNIIDVEPMEPVQAMSLLKTKLTTECMEETGLELLKSLRVYASGDYTSGCLYQSRSPSHNCLKVSEQLQ
jgi:hypothetical protein